MASPTYTETNITQHTVWGALTGEPAPLAVAPAPLPHAGLDSRDIQPGDLFVALAGQQTDGHSYIDAALAQGAAAIICEERGMAAARQAGAGWVDCRRSRWALHATLPVDYTTGQPLVYVVDDSTVALQQVGAFQRQHRTSPALKVIGITGSVGKTSTKELAAALLQQHYRTLANRGNLNSEQGLPLTLLRLGGDEERAVLEMGMYDLGEIARLCVLARPTIGLVTMVGPVHLERLGTIERIAQAKAELVQALPAADDGGVAILNWDDERVRAMAGMTAARIFRYGFTPEADLWADEVQSMGMEGIRFRFHYRQPGQQRVESLHLRAPLLGSHSVQTALAATAIALVEELSWEQIVAGLQSAAGQLRLVVVAGINGATVIDDTYNASPTSTIAALNVLADVQPRTRGRRIAVLGDMRELGSYTDEGHKLVGRRAADLVDVLVTVGELGAAIAAEAGDVGFNRADLHATAHWRDTVSLLQQLLQAGDMVLVKGSRAVGMETIVDAIVVNGDHRLAEDRA